MGISSDAILFTVTSVIKNDGATDTIIVTLTEASDTPSRDFKNYKFVQSEALTESGVAVHRYGAYIFPESVFETELDLVLEYNGATYIAKMTPAEISVGDSATFNPENG